MPFAEPFLVGLNLPWQRYGCDLGANAWQPGGGVAQPGRTHALDELFALLSDKGVGCLRWFLLCDGRAGLSGADAPGGPCLDAHARHDLDAALALLDRHRLRAMFVLFDFHWFLPARTVDGVQLGGRGALLADASSRSRVLDGVVTPLVTHAAGHPAVIAWDVLNEPEWVATRIGPLLGRAPLERDALRGLLGDLVARVREAGRRPVTVGLASPAGLDLVRGLGLDVYQVHWYDRFGLDAALTQHASALGLDAPVLLGEFPMRGSALGPGTIVEAAERLGYAGALGWSLLADDAASGGLKGLADVAHWVGTRFPHGD